MIFKILDSKKNKRKTYFSEADIKIEFKTLHKNGKV